MSNQTTRHDHPDPGERLDSWKAIASYLNRDVTTVQRWEKRESMPVHRHLHDKLGSVYAFRSELDAWVRSRKAQPGPTAFEFDEGPLRPAPATRRWPWLVALRCSLLAIGWAAATACTVRRLPLSGSPADLRIESVTDFDGLEQAAAISPDGRFAAFLSDRDGRPDVWVSRLGSGQFRNLTRGSAPELINPSVRTLGFTPDGESVTFWVRRPGESAKPESGSGLLRCPAARRRPI